MKTLAILGFYMAVVSFIAFYFYLVIKNKNKEHRHIGGWEWE